MKKLFLTCISSFHSVQSDVHCTFNCSFSGIIRSTSSNILPDDPTQIQTIRRQLLLKDRPTDPSEFQNSFRLYMSQAANQFIEKYQLKFQLTK